MSYFSFLLCSHDNGRLVNLYINGQPIGTIREGTFELRKLAPNDRPMSLRDLPDPLPFNTQEELWAALRQAVDQIVLHEPPTKNPPS